MNGSKTPPAIVRGRSSLHGIAFVEDEVEDAIDPNARALKLWHHVLLLCVVYEMFLIPYFMAFRGDSSLMLVPETKVTIAMELFFLVDFGVQAHTGYYEDGNLVRDMRRTRRRYLTSLAFLRDVFTIIPFSWMIHGVTPRAALELHKEYLASLFWAFGVLSGLFEAELPHSILQFLFTIGTSEPAEAKVKQLRHLLKFHHVPEHLQRHAIDYLRRYYTDVESNDRELEDFFVSNAKFILYGQGEVIYRQGDYASGVYFLLEGDVCVITNAENPRVASALVSSPSMPSTTSEGSDSGHELYAPVTPEAEPVLSRGRRSKELRGGGAAVTPKDKALKRARRSEIERKSRLRRLDELNRMRDEIQRLQWTYNNLAQAEDIDHLIEKMAVKNCALSVGARQRVIVRLRFMAQLLSEEHLRLREMLSEHELFQKAIEATWGFEPSGLTDECAPAAVDDREWVSPTRCFAFLRETYELICRFDESRDFVSTGASFMGWTDRRRIDEESSHLQYGFAKQFPLEHAEVLLNRSWDVFSDEKQWCRLVDPSVSTEYQIIQVINSDLVIVRRRHRHAQHHLVFTTAHVLFRLRTPQGYLLEDEMDRFLVDMYASPVEMAPPAGSSCSAVSTPTDTSSVEDVGSPWSGDDDHALMEILMTADDVPMDAAADDSDGVSRKEAAAGKQRKPSSAAKGAKAAASTKQKMKLSATERRARHREVVRRSYHRNKQTLSELRAIVEQLEDEFRTLTVSRDPVVDGIPIETQQRVEELKKQCAELNATSEELRRESVRLQSKLVRHHEYARVVHECFDDTNESSSDDEEDLELECSSPGTSEEDMSPHKHPSVSRSPHVIHRPTCIVDLTPPAPIARDARREVGFTPLSLVTAKQLVSRTYEGILSFKLCGQAVSTGARVLGWEDKRFVDGTAVNFSLRKSFAGRSCFDVMARTWKCFSDPTCASHRSACCST
ncbi:hypothetical protein P43SY_008829 [Pythium insidiosum]|uniref:Cyclic nucleotide-binding domain-containing protein n=1 Tax=Pythium insidiosum TaxID=114742 RepID=A0AAD5LIW4_PYTIN|nr:hypothetical protein P43SY_008829 [Pythium insidiosum]